MPLMILTTRYESNPTANVWHGSKKIHMLENHILKILSGIRRYFEKQREIELFYLTAEVEYCNTALFSSLTNT